MRDGPGPLVLFGLDISDAPPFVCVDCCWNADAPLLPFGVAWRRQRWTPAITTLHNLRHGVHSFCSCISPLDRQILLCATGLFVGYGAAALAQEYAIRELHFSYSSILGASIPFAIFAFGACFGGLEGRKAPIPQHLLCGFLSFTTFQLSALSPLYLNYPTHIIFKSSKILPTMLIGALWLRRSYSWMDYLAAVFLILGLSTFVLADASVTPNFHFFGLVVILTALAADALMSNMQEKLFKQYKASQNEVATWSMGFAFAISMVVGLTVGSDVDGVMETVASPLLLGIVVTFALANYLGTYFVLTMIRRFGASPTVFTTSVCKAATMALSFVLFPKPFTAQHLMGSLLVAGGVYVNVKSKQQAAAEKPLDDTANAKAAAKHEHEDEEEENLIKAPAANGASISASPSHSFSPTAVGPSRASEGDDDDYGGGVEGPGGRDKDPELAQPRTKASSVSGRGRGGIELLSFGKEGPARDSRRAVEPHSD